MSRVFVLDSFEKFGGLVGYLGVNGFLRRISFDEVREKVEGARVILSHLNGNGRLRELLGIEKFLSVEVPLEEPFESFLQSGDVVLIYSGGKWFLVKIEGGEGDDN